MLNQGWDEHLIDGSMKLLHSDLSIEFSPYELGEFVLGIVTSIPLDEGLFVEWTIGQSSRHLRVIESRPFQSGKYDLRLSLVDRDIPIPELIGVRSVSRDNLRIWPESSRFQSARFPLGEMCPIHLNTFGVPETFQFDVINVSQTGLLVQRPSRLPQSAPFIKSTLLEATIDPSETPSFSPTGGPHNFLAKVVWSSWGDYENQYVQRFGLSIIRQDEMDARWNKWVQSIELRHIHDRDWSSSA